MSQHPHDTHHPNHTPHRHGHGHDHGPRAVLRYLRHLPRMWRSDVNDAVVRELGLRRGDRVIDLGAGVGAAAAVAAREGADVLAVDPMPLMRALLRLRRAFLPGGPGVGSIRVAEGAAESIPAPDASANVACTVNTLHHWTNVDAAARELARVLVPGGRVLLLDEDFESHEHAEHSHWRDRRERSGLHFDDVDPERFAEALRRAGFAHAEGSRSRLAGRPVKLVRGTR